MLGWGLKEKSLKLEGARKNEENGVLTGGSPKKTPGKRILLTNTLTANYQNKDTRGFSSV